MTPEQGRALDRQLTTSPSDCADGGHDWHFTGYDAEGDPIYICRRCCQESEA